jgi:uncharacterized protein (TIGR00106 family)
MKDSVIADIKILPLGTGTSSVSRLIADCISLLGKEPDIKYQVTSMATIIEGPLDIILNLVKKMHEVPFSNGVTRVVTSISIDDRRDKRISMEGKVKAIKERISS